MFSLKKFKEGETKKQKIAKIFMKNQGFMDLIQNKIKELNFFGN